MVGEDLDGEGRSREVLLPCFKGVEDGEELSVIDVIVTFGRGERLGEVGAWMPFAIGVSLEKYSSGGELGGICSQGKGGVGVGKLEYGLGEEELLQLVEGFLTGRGPVPGMVFLGEV